MARPKVLVVLTSTDKIPADGRETGWYLPEFAHPYNELKDKVDFSIASVKGGLAPLDPVSVKLFSEDPVCVDFKDNHQALWSDTKPLSAYTNATDGFDAVLFPGGHGPMFDLADNAEAIALVEKFAAQRKPVASICHGVVALTRAKGPDGQPLVKGRTVTGFSNAEEEAAGYTKIMPFLLEDRLRDAGANYTKAEDLWKEKVVVDENIITGQNPASGKALGQAIAKALKT